MGKVQEKEFVTVSYTTSSGLYGFIFFFTVENIPSSNGQFILVEHLPGNKNLFHSALETPE
jgi:hypothetical protein